VERLTLFADIIVPLSVPNKYTYRVPYELNGIIQKGQRVLVQFGKAKIYTGIVYKIHQNPPEKYSAKYVEAVLDDEPIVNEQLLVFWDWISFYYCANPGDVMNAALPSGLKLSSSSHLQLNPDFNLEELSHDFFTEKEHQIIDALQVNPSLTFDDIAGLLNIKSVQGIINKLLKKNAVLVYEDVKEKYKPKMQAFIKLSPGYGDNLKLGEILNQLEKKAFKQAEALLYFIQLTKNPEQNLSGWINKSLLTKRIDNAAIAALVKKSVFIEQHFEIGRLLFEKSNTASKSLSGLQQEAYQKVINGFSEKKPVLLHGVTGSGKTEIYIQLIKDAILQNKQILFLIPEIALTTQLITRIRAVFGEIVGLYHSRFSENERVEIWNNILQKDNSSLVDKTKYKIILGARSSLFLPFENLGLIIVDEEHDSSFKQHDPAPRYHARDAALYLAQLHGANIVLGSATPSVESYFNAGQNKYRLVNLDKQFVQSGGTQLEICDLIKYERSDRMKACLTPPLYDAIVSAIEKKEQVILFQNRRGFAPYTECRQCGNVPHCVQCDVSLIYHKQREKLLCHYCGYSTPPLKSCAACGSNSLYFKGMGTEKIEEDIEVLFPRAKIARMDLDSTRSKYAYKQLIDDFESGGIDILIGTQMVTKGLDFDNVSVVGVLNADAILNFPDFRSFERAFQLITQVRGRAGRNKKIGNVFVQTTKPEHHVLTFIKNTAFIKFYEDILTERKQHNYPPFSRLIELNVVSKDLNEVNHLAAELFLLLKPSFGIHLLGPEFPLISKIKNKYYKRILIKSFKSEAPTIVRQKIFDSITELQNNYRNWRYTVSIDVDPV
jgi:primosomal protein N' (replication factor Y) (superfamily II helicase)